MAGPQPLLSVVTPVLNGEASLSACIESVQVTADLAARDGHSIECIIADGGSSDASLSIAREHAARAGSCITSVIEGPDAGQSDAINKGMAGACGRYRAWLNADDVYRPEAMAAMLHAVASSDPEVVVGRCRFVDAAGRTVFEPVPPAPIDVCSLTRLLTGWFAGRSLVQPEVLVRRDVWDRAGGLDVGNHFSMDHQLWLRLASAGVRWVRRDEVVALQVVHSGQKTVDNEAVVRSMLAHSEAAAEGCEVSRRELAIVRERLARFDRARRGGSGEVSALLGELRRGRAAELKARVGLEAGRGLRPVVCVDVEGAAAPAGAVRFSGRVPSLPAAAAVVVADAPTLRYGPGAIGALSALLRPDGVLIAGGEPVAVRWEAAGRALRTSLADSLTRPPGRSLLDDENRVIGGWLSLLGRPLMDPAPAVLMPIRADAESLRSPAAGLARGAGLFRTVSWRKHGRDRLAT